ncbi:histone H1 [Rubricoccus marinus]|uniref:Histone H1 n=1 Tax=Rubricoccus marinus TaxID=716817 RepID=A0A259TYY0_9BACT|nr:histone H1 [Rubricoccus marinus]OZC02985.1 histone H1 [Rubricoccus marinus]
MANHYDDLKEMLENSEDDFKKFYEKGNKAAGTRIRKTMQEIKAKAQDIRNDVQEKKNAE